MFILKSGECGQICRKRVEEILKQMEANDARAICVLGCCYHQGVGELQHDDERAIELWKQAANHYKAAAMAGHKVSRFNVGRVVSRVILEKWNELLRIGQLQH